MNATLPTAADQLILQNPMIRPEVVAEAQQAAEMLRKLGLLSTKPTEAIRPFNRRPADTLQPTAVRGWAAATDIRLTKVS